ncbi:hypothetical protein BKA62DRAFT_680275 [Auriculariales sp. MPI-PUGE-AT-0066]|nr:hypothetical protein BKA62DRAFT_680275 [Auriculariales sp. MPI-PUGE-AT-0066]
MQEPRLDSADRSQMLRVAVAELRGIVGQAEQRLIEIREELRQETNLAYTTTVSERGSLVFSHLRGAKGCLYVQAEAESYATCVAEASPLHTLSKENWRSRFRQHESANTMVRATPPRRRSEDSQEARDIDAIRETNGFTRLKDAPILSCDSAKRAEFRRVRCSKTAAVAYTSLNASGRCDERSKDRRRQVIAAREVLANEAGPTDRQALECKHMELQQLENFSAADMHRLVVKQLTGMEIIYHHGRVSKPIPPQRWIGAYGLKVFEKVLGRDWYKAAD